MGITTYLYLVLLAFVAFLRLMEVRISRRNQRRLAQAGVAKMPEPQFRWMVLFHVGILIAAGSEVAFLHRSFHPLLGATMGLVFLLATGLRWWVIRAMSEHWNIQVMASGTLGVVTDGPFRWIRHPNYAAVFIELIALPLIHGAWITALLGAVIHSIILRRRIQLEEAVLISSTVYRETMGYKPRFLPGRFHSNHLASNTPRSQRRGAS